MVAAVSGGFDSTALLLALAALRCEGREVLAGHVNHHLRGDESDADEEFVRRLCEQLGVRLEVADGSLEPESVRELGVEAAARHVRTRLLLAIRDSAGARYVATAHQKNDQAETVLMRLLTGSGIAGLRAIHPVREDGFIRPLLDVTRAEIEAFLAERGVTPRFDRMNADSRFLRVRARATVQEYGAAAVEGLASVAAQARDVWALVERELDRLEDVALTPESTEFRSLPEDAFLRRALLLRHIRRLEPGAREIGAADLERIDGQLTTLTRLSVTRSLELVRKEALVLRRKERCAAPDYALVMFAEESRTIPEADLTITVRRAKGDGIGDPARQLFQLPVGSPAEFTLRNRRPGDRFQPLGMDHSKKLSDFLIDRKVPAEARETLPLLLWKGEIIWIAGIAVSQTVRVSDDPGDRYVAEVEPGNGRAPAPG